MLTEAPNALSLSADDLAIDREDLFRCIGYLDGVVPGGFRERADELWAEAFERFEIRAGYSLWPIVPARDHFIVGDRRFDCGRIIGGALKGCERVAVTLITLGPKVDTWIREYFDIKDGFSGYMADTIGSVTADAAMTWLAGRVAADAAAEGFGATNNYSPGYCDWNVAQQQGLFALLPERFCGVRLTESSLMMPIKSVSGVVGIGPGVRKVEYECRACPMDDCLYRAARLRKKMAGGVP